MCTSWLVWYFMVFWADVFQRSLHQLHQNTKEKMFLLSFIFLNQTGIHPVEFQTTVQSMPRRTEAVLWEQLIVVQLVQVGFYCNLANLHIKLCSHINCLEKLVLYTSSGKCMCLMSWVCDRVLSALSA